MSDKTSQLSLVPLEELIDEISSRNEFFVCAYKPKFGKSKTIFTQWKDDGFFGNLALCEALKFDILREPNKEVEE